MTLLMVGMGVHAHAQPTNFSLPPMPPSALGRGTTNASANLNLVPPIPSSPIAPNAGAQNFTKDSQGAIAQAAKPEMPPGLPERASPEVVPEAADTAGNAQQIPPALQKLLEQGGAATGGEPIKEEKKEATAAATSAAPYQPPGLPPMSFALPEKTPETAAVATPPSGNNAGVAGTDGGLSASQPKPKGPTWNTHLASSAWVPRTRFNYRRSTLPGSIYRYGYDGENLHLPTRITRADYTSLLFQRVAANDVDGTRALLNTGLPVSMRDAYGQSLLSIARRYRAGDTYRLLVARGAS